MTKPAMNKRAELQFLSDQIHALEETITAESLKAFVVCGLELYLSQALVLGLFECVDPAMRDEQELQYMTNMAWIPLIWGLALAFGHRIAPRIAPAPENLDRNLRNSKLLTWVYTLAFLIWDKDMAIKRGPALQVAAMFAVCDLARYEMEIAHLIEDDDDELDGDHEVDTLAHAVSVAGVENERETEFKNQLQSVAGRSGSSGHVPFSDDEQDDQTPGARSAIGAQEASYRQYDAETPMRKYSGSGDRREF